MVPFKIAMDKGDVFVEGSPRADDQEIARLAREAWSKASIMTLASWR